MVSARRDRAPKQNRHETVEDSPREATDRKMIAVQPFESGPNEISIWCMDLLVKCEGGECPTLFRNSTADSVEYKENAAKYADQNHWRTEHRDY